MAGFEGKVAIVTGGASGIGRAISAELLQRGTRVVVADINESLAVKTAAELGATAMAAAVDVTDPVAVQRVVDETVQVHGRLDFMFNNAGIAIFGDVRDMTLEDWNRLIDVNLRGVIHGIQAAYPVMIRQGAGHIVNTGSAAGLAPSPGGTGYCMTKHGVVGLSTSLRAEAGHYGVKVSVVCPGFIDTPIAQSAKLITTPDREKMLKAFPFKLHPAEMCARVVCNGVARNKAIIPVTSFTRIGWFLYRLSPSLLIRLTGMASKWNPLLGRD